MAATALPTMDAWYQSIDGEPFEVVALDEHDGTIEIQYLDGSIAELNMEAWYSLEVRTIAPPSEAYDDMEDEAYVHHNDLDDFDSGFSDWSSSYDDYLD